jgi:uncharacterized protein YydD (DUF2326 family)
VIHRIYSSLKTFKEIRFGSGLNLLLADKVATSTAKQTRNGAGKSSLLEIVHFLTAGDCSDGSVFLFPELVESRFGMEFDLGGQVITVERSGSHPNEILIVGGDTSTWPVKPIPSEHSGANALTVKEWARVLGVLMFKLEDNQGPTREAYAPTFRSLFPYFVRRLPGGFTEPHLHFVQGKPGIWQVAISYLLGLDWTIPQEWQIVRDQEEEIKKLKKVVGEGDLSQIVGRKAQLRTQIATAKSEVQKFGERLSTFQVLPDFREYERRASRLTQQLSDLIDANTLDEEMLRDLERAIAEETPPHVADLTRVYKEAGITLPDQALRRFADVRKFHESVILNRRSYLTSEIDATKQRVQAREQQKVALSQERSEIMTILKSHGALEQFINLQSDFGRKTADLELLRKRFSAAEKIEEGLTKLKIRRQELLLRLKRDYSEQSETLNLAIVTFEEISARLYQKTASFTPAETDNGPEFRIEVEGERSPGIRNMQIFCFDMTITQLNSRRGVGPGFLIHDSHLFDPVDSRQVGTALSFGAVQSKDTGFQYIVTLNSDKQVDVPDGFTLADFEIPVKLTDTVETGGLFGIRFG